MSDIGRVSRCRGWRYIHTMTARWRAGLSWSAMWALEEIIRRKLFPLSFSNTAREPSFRPDRTSFSRTNTSTCIQKDLRQHFRHPIIPVKWHWLHPPSKLWCKNCYSGTVLQPNTPWLQGKCLPPPSSSSTESWKSHLFLRERLPTWGSGAAENASLQAWIRPGLAHSHDPPRPHPPPHTHTLTHRHTDILCVIVVILTLASACRIGLGQECGAAAAVAHSQTQLFHTHSQGVSWLGMGIVFISSFRYRCLNRYFKKRSTKQGLKMRTLKTSSAIFTVKAVLKATLTKNGYQTVALVASASYELA